MGREEPVRVNLDGQIECWTSKEDYWIIGRPRGLLNSKPLDVLLTGLKKSKQIYHRSSPKVKWLVRKSRPANRPADRSPTLPNPVTDFLVNAAAVTAPDPSPSRRSAGTRPPSSSSYPGSPSRGSSRKWPRTWSVRARCPSSRWKPWRRCRRRPSPSWWASSKTSICAASTAKESPSCPGTSSWRWDWEERFFNHIFMLLTTFSVIINLEEIIYLRIILQKPHTSRILIAQETFLMAEAFPNGLPRRFLKGKHLILIRGVVLNPDKRTIYCSFSGKKRRRQSKSNF